MTSDALDVPALCVGLWISEDGTRAMRLACDADGGLRVSVWQRLGARAHLVDRPARWHPPSPAAAGSADARLRLGFLQAEVGTPGLGSTYDLMVATRNHDPAAFAGFDWRPVAAGARRDDVRLFPQGGASYIEAVLGYWDDSVEAIRDADRWMQPLSTWRPASGDEAAREITPSPLPR